MFKSWKTNKQSHNGLIKSNKKKNSQDSGIVKRITFLLLFLLICKPFIFLKKGFKIGSEKNFSNLIYNFVACHLISEKQIFFKDVNFIQTRLEDFPLVRSIKLLFSIS
jgi:hypothetical protein